MTSHAGVAVDTTVPWHFSQAGNYTQWLWTTRDFTGLVVFDGKNWTFEVKTVAAIQLATGPAQDFDTAADLVLEVVGKAYPDSAGYGRWAKAASKKYSLASGARVDLSSGDGKAVRVTLAGGGIIDGVLHLGDWLLHVVADGVQRDIDSSTVSRVDRLA